MPAKPEGVYADGRGGWYFKVTLGRYPLTAKRVQITKSGFRTATEAGRARRDVLTKVDTGQVRPSSKLLTVDDALDLYLDGIDADGRLSVKTRSTTGTMPTSTYDRRSALGRSGTSPPR